MNRWERLADRVLEGRGIGRAEALAVLRAPDAETESVVRAAERVRRFHHANTVKIHVLLNAKSGACPEDCAFCSQSAYARTPIERYRLMTEERIVEAARCAKAAGAWKFCIVTATRGPSERDLDVICGAVRRIKQEVGVRVCTSLGILANGQARRLAEAGVDRFNHNLETSQRFFPRICTTHTYEDRVRTVREAQAAGMEACCGGIVGMGESEEDVVDLAFAVRALGVTSIPVNFLNPRPGTPLEGRAVVDARYALRVLAMVRLVNPGTDVRAAGGREVALGPLQGYALRVANSIFTNGYLTTGGNAAEADRAMIARMGMEIYGGG